MVPERERFAAALRQIASMPNESDEWDGAEKFEKARAIAREALGDDDSSAADWQRWAGE